MSVSSRLEDIKMCSVSVSHNKALLLLVVD